MLSHLSAGSYNRNPRFHRRPLSTLSHDLCFYRHEAMYVSYFMCASSESSSHPTHHVFFLDLCPIVEVRAPPRRNRATNPGTHKFRCRSKSPPKWVSGLYDPGSLAAQSDRVPRGPGPTTEKITPLLIFPSLPRMRTASPAKSCRDRLTN